MQGNQNSLPLEQRVARLEGKLGWRNLELQIPKQFTLWSVALLGLALFFAYLGLGMPNHYYQLVLAVLTICLCYQRGWLLRAPGIGFWLTATLNSLVLATLFKLFIGSGKRFPWYWLQYPVLRSAPRQDSSMLPSIPSFELQWEPSALALWSADLTIIQTFLLLITLFGALVEFQPFASFTALLLIVFSLPALASFEWQWVFPALITAAVALYAQTPAAHQRDAQKPQTAAS